MAGTTAGPETTEPTPVAAGAETGAAQPPLHADSSGPPGRSRPRTRWWLLCQWAVVAAFIAFLLYLHVAVARVAYVPSESMEPTLQAGDRVVVRKDAYRSRAPRRGEIVVFRTGEGYEIKRIIAVAGDTLAIGLGQVWLNGRQLQEPYLLEPMIWERPLGPYQVPAGQVFVMGDNRNHSGDSRDDGPVDTDTILGRATRVLLPLQRAKRIE